MQDEMYQSGSVTMKYGTLSNVGHTIIRFCSNPIRSVADIGRVPTAGERVHLIGIITSVAFHSSNLS